MKIRNLINSLIYVFGFPFAIIGFFTFWVVATTYTGWLIGEAIKDYFKP